MFKVLGFRCLRFWGIGVYGLGCLGLQGLRL